ncbi:Cupredoxin [Xylariales sp. AK1849]|nr:Cupredoxin [Xylariales sp. AK1849]
MHIGTLGLLTTLATGAWAKTVTYDWEVTWVNAAPDGFERPVVGINGQWPCPPLEACVGDTVVVNLKNGLGNQTTGLHFHGISQINTNFMDGASMVNQCPLLPGSSIKYEFLADAPGTYWYHSHNMGQYPDGLRGAFVVYDATDPYADQYDEEVILTLSDWYHSQTLPLVQTLLGPNNIQFQPPFPDTLIVNEGQGSNIQLDIGKTYRVRIISFAALASFMVHFGSHTMDVIMTDASYVQKQEAYQLRVAPAQRYDVLISGIDRDQGQNFPYLIAMDVNRDYTAAGATWNYNHTGYLITDSSLPTDGDDVVDSFQPIDEGHFAPYDSLPALGPVTKTWELDFDFCRDVNNYTRACFNGQTYIGQKTPTLYSAATLGEAASDPASYGDVNPFVVEYGDVVELVVNNLDVAIHPFHLHGHQFQVVDRPHSGAGRWSGGDGGINQTPPKRDVVAVNGNSFAVLRFVADNPGVFLFHCHIEWHVEMGLTATLIEAPEKLQGLPIPQDHLDACNAQGIPTSGNAAGNKDPSDHSGFVTVPPTSYYGAGYPIPGSQPGKRQSRELKRKFGSQRRGASSLAG